MLHEHWFSEDWDEQGPTVYSNYYPPNEVRRQPEWLTELLQNKIEIKGLVQEVYRALAIGALRLATMGIRALVEKIMIDRVGDRGNFERTIPAFFDAGYIAPMQQEMFKNTLIEAGHAAMHRGWEPVSDEVITLLDIVEGLLKSIYVDVDAAAKVGKRIPRRGPRGAK